MPTPTRLEQRGRRHPRLTLFGRRPARPGPRAGASVAQVGVDRSPQRELCPAANAVSDSGQVSTSSTPFSNPGPYLLAATHELTYSILATVPVGRVRSAST